MEMEMVIVVVAGGQLVKLGSFNRSTIAVEDVFADMSGWMYGWLSWCMRGFFARRGMCVSFPVLRSKVGRDKCRRSHSASERVVSKLERAVCN